MMEDRVALAEGRRQIYGSQLRQVGGDPRMFVSPLEDPDHVDERRASVGLPPMAEYLKIWNLTWDVEAYKQELPVLEALAAHKFGARYDQAAGLVRASPAGSDRLAPELAVVGDGRRADPHVDFFLKANPGYAQGDELACLASLHPSNMRPIASRVVQRVRAAGTP